MTKYCVAGTSMPMREPFQKVFLSILGNNQMTFSTRASRSRSLKVGYYSRRLDPIHKIESSPT